MLILLSLVLLLVGAAGIIFPLIPGIPLAWLGLLLLGMVTGFNAISVQVVVIFFGFTFLTLLFDVAAPLLGARRYQASRAGIIGAGIGCVVGIFLLGPFGLIVGPLCGALAGEFWIGRETSAALRSAQGVVLGFLIGSLLKVVLVLTMLGFWIKGVAVLLL